MQDLAPTEERQLVVKLMAPVRVEGITRAILVLRGHRVLLDEALAELYGVETKVLIQAVKSNPARFPDDFMFQLTTSEWAGLRSQTVTSKPRRGGRRYAPYAFTEQGVAMLSSVLNSDRAIAVNIQVMGAAPRPHARAAADRADPAPAQVPAGLRHADARYRARPARSRSL